MVNYGLAAGRGIETGRDVATDCTLQLVLHPIETGKQLGLAVWDGYNALGGLATGGYLETAGAIQRNAHRGMVVNTWIDNFSKADTAGRIESISALMSGGILTMASGGVVGGTAAELGVAGVRGSAIEAQRLEAISHRVSDKVLFQ